MAQDLQATQRMLSLVCLILWMQCAQSDPLPCSRSYYLAHNTSQGVIRSPNYPFNYQNDLTCNYTIFMSNDISANYKLCFRFHRFYLEYGAQLLYRDYINLTTLKEPGRYPVLYHGRGYLLYDGHYPNNLWLDDFCFIDLPFSIVFDTDVSTTQPGFYAEFYTLPRTFQFNHTKEEMCESPGRWRCFNRKCTSSDALCDNNNDCGDWSDETYAHARCTHGNHKPNLYMCDFEDSVTNHCGLGSSLIGWKVESYSKRSGYGPTYDHTTGNSGGSYIRTDFYHQSDAISVTLRDNTYVSFMPSQNMCFSFWYHMNGNDVGSLTLHWLPTNDRYQERLLWRREGIYGNHWHHGELTLNYTTFIKDGGLGMLKFTATRGSERHVEIALDDLALTDEPCSGDDISCTFASDFCGWTPDPASDPDDSSGTFYIDREEGHLVMSHAGDVTPMIKSQYVTLAYEHTSGQSRQYREPSSLCFTFQARAASNHIRAEITIIMDIPDGLNSWMMNEYLEQLERRETLTSDWFTYKLSMNSYEPFKIILAQDHAYYKVYIRNVQLINLPCDEIDTGTSCSAKEFRCGDGTCISNDLACNGENDCLDESDESTQACCTKSGCRSDEFCCKDRCIEKNWVCDGENDCTDWMDERHCNTSACNDSLFRCHDGSLCIHQRYICNHKENCDDGSDEFDCARPFASQYLPGLLGGVVLIGFLVGAIIFLSRYLQARGQLPCCTGTIIRSEENEEDEPRDIPPVYDDVIDNTTMYPRPLQSLYASIRRSIRRVTGAREAVPPPPTYDDVSKGDFVEITVPSAKNIDSVRKHMSARQQSVTSDSSAQISNNKSESPDGAMSGVPRMPTGLGAKRYSASVIDTGASSTNTTEPCVRFSNLDRSNGSGSVYIIRPSLTGHDNNAFEDIPLEPCPSYDDIQGGVSPNSLQQITHESQHWTEESPPSYHESNKAYYTNPAYSEDNVENPRANMSERAFNSVENIAQSGRSNNNISLDESNQFEPQSNQSNNSNINALNNDTPNPSASANASPAEICALDYTAHTKQDNRGHNNVSLSLHQPDLDATSFDSDTDSLDSYGSGRRKSKIRSSSYSQRHSDSANGSSSRSYVIRHDSRCLDSDGEYNCDFYCCQKVNDQPGGSNTDHYSSQSSSITEPHKHPVKSALSVMETSENSQIGNTNLRHDIAEEGVSYSQDNEHCLQHPSSYINVGTSSDVHASVQGTEPTETNNTQSVSSISVDGVNDEIGLRRIRRRISSNVSLTSSEYSV